METTYTFVDATRVHRISLLTITGYTQAKFGWQCSCGDRQPAPGTTGPRWSKPEFAEIMGAHHVREATADMVPVGEPKPTPKNSLWKPGWAWGSTGGANEWLTIAGSAYERVVLAPTPAEAGPCPVWFSPTLALVAPVYHPGVTVTQTAFWILQLAEPVARS